MEQKCPKCSGTMVAGVGSAAGLIGTLVESNATPHLQFVVPGAPTSPNPISAFKQGLHDDSPDQVYWLRGLRCTACGFVEFYAGEKAD